MSTPRRVSLSLAAAVLAGGPAAASTARQAARVGEPFPALVLPSIADGSPLSIASFRGRVVLLHQFASW